MSDADSLEDRPRAKPGRGKWILLAVIGVPLLCCGLGVLFIVPAALFAGLDTTPEIEMEFLQAESDLFTLAHAVDAYRAREGAYPGTLEQLVESGDLATGDQLFDPWGNEYLYLLPEEGEWRELRTLRTLGADARRGGSGADADITKVVARD